MTELLGQILNLVAKFLIIIGAGCVCFVIVLATVIVNEWKESQKVIKARKSERKEDRKCS